MGAVRPARLLIRPNNNDPVGTPACHCRLYGTARSLPPALPVSSRACARCGPASTTTPAASSGRKRPARSSAAAKSGKASSRKPLIAQAASRRESPRP
jgi:hypothetical protein